jgi:uncharacterized protein (DUF302 family)
MEDRMIQTDAYSLSVEVALPYAQARERVVTALKENGFGVLTEIDVKATMKQKLDVEFRKYSILGACNPPLAHKALSADSHIGVLLPCNLVVYENGPSDSTIVSIDPEVQLGKTGRPELAEVAREVRTRLMKVLMTASSLDVPPAAPGVGNGS